MKNAGWALTLCALSLAGCAGFPARPVSPTLPTAVPIGDTGQGAGPDTAGQWPQQRWWRRYQDTTLDRLIETGLASAPTLKTARARFDSARESVRLASASRGAHVDLAGDVERQRLSDNGLFPPQLLGFHWYNQSDLGLQAGYTFDWWGKQRAAVAAAVDQAHAAEADRSAAALVLASSIADTYFGWQADQQRLELARQRLTVAERVGRIAGDRLRADLDSADAGHHADEAIAAIREQIEILEGSARLRIIALAALVGCAPADLPALQAGPLPVVTTSLPDNVRLDLVARRADITASRWRVEAAQQYVRAARAEYFPDISINALAGVSAIDVGKLLEYGSRAPEAGLALHLPIFDAGRLDARYRGSQAQLRSAIADYEQTLIDAARDVASQAATRQQVLAQRAQRLIQVEAAARLRAGAAAKVRQGLSDARLELTETESWLEQRDAVSQLDLQALAADIGLQRALGGGYQAQPGLANSQPLPGKANP
ncbi:MAG: efflux transporter outer membrane subunit [Steroidobacterales bacterium]